MIDYLAITRPETARKASRPTRCKFIEWDRYRRIVGDCYRADCRAAGPERMGIRLAALQRWRPLRLWLAIAPRSPSCGVRTSWPWHEVLAPRPGMQCWGCPRLVCLPRLVDKYPFHEEASPAGQFRHEPDSWYFKFQDLDVSKSRRGLGSQ